MGKRTQGAGLTLIFVLLIVFAFSSSSGAASYRDEYDTYFNNTLPWDPVDAETLRSSPRKVYSHYFSPFPISIDNRNSSVDYYATQYLNPFGESSKFLYCGGWLRCRPPPRSSPSSGNWSLIDMQTEVQRGIRMGLDGFFYDVLTTQGLLGNTSNSIGSRFKLLLQAAKNVDPEFKIGFTPDMNAEFKTQPENLYSLLMKYGNDPGVIKDEFDRTIIAPFLAEVQNATFWTNLILQLNNSDPQVRASFLPVFLNGGFSAQFARSMSKDVLLGLSSWGGRTVAAAQGVNASCYNAHNLSSLYMLPVAVQDFRPKSNFWFESNNTVAFRTFWENMIQYSLSHPTESNWVQLLTWNDYSEHTQVSPNDCSGTSISDIANYYIIWFKTGQAPEIKRDGIYYFHRVHNTNITATPVNGTKLQLDDFHLQLTASPASLNNIEMVAFLRGGSEEVTMRIIVNGVNYDKVVNVIDSNRGGLFSFSISLVEGVPEFQIIRSGSVALSIISKFPIQSTVAVQDMSLKSRGIVEAVRVASSGVDSSSSDSSGGGPGNSSGGGSTRGGSS